MGSGLVASEVEFTVGVVRAVTGEVDPAWMELCMGRLDEVVGPGPGDATHGGREMPESEVHIGVTGQDEAAAKPTGLGSDADPGIAGPDQLQGLDELP